MKRFALCDVRFYHRCNAGFLIGIKQNGCMPDGSVTSHAGFYKADRSPYNLQPMLALSVHFRPSAAESALYGGQLRNSNPQTTSTTNMKHGKIDRCGNFAHGPPERETESGPVRKDDSLRRNCRKLSPVVQPREYSDESICAHSCAPAR